MLDDHIKETLQGIIDGLETAPSDIVAAIKALSELERMSREEALRRELFGI